jgi:Bacterial SH3 domain
MHRVLLALWLIGAGIYAGFGLITPPDQPVMETVNRVDRGAVQPSKAAPKKTTIVEQTAHVPPFPTTPHPRAPPNGVPDAATHAPGVMPPETDPGEVSHGAPVHNGPSVASPIVGYAAAGASVELGERNSGWVKIIDPKTRNEGWIYEIYVSTDEQKGLEAEPMREPLEEAAVAPSEKRRLTQPKPKQSVKHSVKSKKSKKQYVSKRKRFKFARRFGRR